MYDRKCSACDWTRADCYEAIALPAPPCPACGAPTERAHLIGGQSANVRQDSIPGGLTLENLGHKPVTVYSHSELRAELDARGLQPFVRHRGARGSDKSRHTTNWAAGVSQEQMDSVAAMLARVDGARPSSRADDEVIDTDGITIEVDNAYQRRSHQHS